MSHAYITKDTKKEEIKSTAYTFLAVSIAGFVLLGLFLSGVLPLETAFYTKIILSIVMGVMFFLFFLIGLRSFFDIKKVQKEAECEHIKYDEITTWFKENYSAADIDTGTDTSQGREQLYFIRYETMFGLLNAKYPHLDESFLDYVLEQLYSELFPD